LLNSKILISHPDLDQSSLQDSVQKFSTQFSHECLDKSWSFLFQYLVLHLSFRTICYMPSSVRRLSQLSKIFFGLRSQSVLTGVAYHSKAQMKHKILEQEGLTSVETVPRKLRGKIFDVSLKQKAWRENWPKSGSGVKIFELSKIYRVLQIFSDFSETLRIDSIFNGENEPALSFQ